MRIEAPARRWALGLCAIGWAALAQAETSPYSLGAGLTWGRESNLFRAPAGEEVADSYTRATLTARLDEQFSRQRLRADVSLHASRYSDRHDLNNTGHGLLLLWDGASAHALSWRLSYDSRRSLASYANAAAPEQRIANIETTHQADATAKLGLAGEWVASLNLSHRVLGYSATAYAPNQMRLGTAGAQLQWQPMGPLSLQLGPRYTRGRYPQARVLADGSTEADRFDRQDIDLGLLWSASGKSSVSARISQTSQSYELGRERDFDGATGLMDWQWQLTGKTQLSASINRDTGSETSFFNVKVPGSELSGTGDNSKLTTGVTAQLRHALTGKVNLQLAGHYARRRVSASTRIEGGGGIPVFESAQEGQERSGSVALAVNYAATRHAQLNCSLGHQRRAAQSTALSSYRADTLSCTAQLSLR
jgi:hypothetical protein